MSSDQRIRAVLAWSLLLPLVAGCGATASDPEPTSVSVSPTPRATGPYPMAEIAALDPAEPFPGAYDDEPAVQVLRETTVVIAWANLTNNSRFAQVTQYIDPSWEPGIVGYSEAVEKNPNALIGPGVDVVESVTANPDGSTTVQVCSLSSDSYSKATGERSGAGASDSRWPIRQLVTLSPLTEAEGEELAGQGLHAPPLRIRGIRLLSDQCDASSAPVQNFVNWRDYAPIGHYGEFRDPDSMDVAVVGEDGAIEYVDPDDLP